jgi:hypothetical protein
MQQLDVDRGGLADAGHGLQLLDRAPRSSRRTSRTGQQRLGHRLDVATREGAEEVELQQFVVGQGAQPAGLGALAQAFAMAQVMRRRLDGRRVRYA